MVRFDLSSWEAARELSSSAGRYPAIGRGRAKDECRWSHRAIIDATVYDSEADYPLPTGCALTKRRKRAKGTLRHYGVSGSGLTLQHAVHPLAVGSLTCGSPQPSEGGDNPDRSQWSIPDQIFDALDCRSSLGLADRDRSARHF